MESKLKVVYNRKSNLFTCIRSVCKNGKSDSIVLHTNSDCNGACRAMMTESEIYCFNKLIEEIKRVIEIANGKDTVGFAKLGNYISADFDCGVNRNAGIQVHCNFNSYRKGEYIPCTFNNRWGRWNY